MPHCFASVSSASTSSPGGTSTAFGASASTRTDTRHSSATIAARGGVDLPISSPFTSGDYKWPRSTVTSERVDSGNSFFFFRNFIATAETLGKGAQSAADGGRQDDPVRLDGLVNGKSLRQEVHEGLDIGRTEDSADLEVGDGGICDDDLALVVPIELSHRVCQPQVAKDQYSVAPAQLMVNLAGQGLLNQHAVVRGPGNRPCRQEQRTGRVRGTRCELGRNRVNRRRCAGAAMGVRRCK